jgi:hypothetical protein
MREISRIRLNSIRNIIFNDHQAAKKNVDVILGLSLFDWMWVDRIFILHHLQNWALDLNLTLESLIEWKNLLVRDLNVKMHNKCEHRSGNPVKDLINQSIDIINRRKEWITWSITSWLPAFQISILTIIKLSVLTANFRKIFNITIKSLFIRKCNIMSHICNNLRVFFAFIDVTGFWVARDTCTNH